MMNIRVILLIVAASCLHLRVSSQVEEVLGDSIIIKEDSVIYESIDQSSKVDSEDSLKYKKLEKLSDRSRFTRFMHNFLFRPVIRETGSRADVYTPHHKKAQGKTIREVHIIPLDPFGYSIRDTSAKPRHGIVEAGNKVHVRTRSLVIRNLLLFGEHDRYDSVIVSESERLIRTQKYIRDIRMDVKNVHKDSVDIFIRVQDVWSIIPAIRASSSRTGLSFTDINFAGLGSTFHASTEWIKPENKNLTHLSYIIPNIRNTYINLSLQYLINWNNDISKLRDFPRYIYSPVSYNPQLMLSDNANVTRSFELSRPFYSPRAEWAGGLFLGRIITFEDMLGSDTLLYLSAPTNLTDLWYGRSWWLNENSMVGERITSLVLSGRFVRTRTPGRSTEIINANLFNNHTYLFGSIDITTRKFVQDKYLFNYGKIEYVPEGRIFGVTLGFEAQVKNRMYIGYNAGWGSYYSFGYLGAHLDYGTFRGKEGFEQGVLAGRINYFTRLFSVGNWKVRQFVRPSFIFGINRLPSDNLIRNLGIIGFDPVISDATFLTVLSLQTQTYAPWKLAGFNFGPYIFTHLGILGNESSGFRNNRFHSLLGAGLLIRNDYLMFNTFQISLSFYPFLPGRGYNIFRMNSYDTSDYGLRDFESMKPGLVDFR